MYQMTLCVRTICMRCEGLNKIINYKNKNLNAKGLKKSVKQNGLDAGGKM